MAKFPYPTFSLEERDRRWARVREMMAREGFDAIIAPNNTGHSTDFQANMRYLTHCGGGGDSDLSAIFPLHGEPTVSAKDANDRWLTVQDWCTDVREADRVYSEVIIERIKELGLEKGRIGVTGLGPGNRTPEGTIGYLQMKAYLDAFPDATFVDATKPMEQVRAVKSDEELAFLTKSTELIEHGIEAKVDTARAGVRDYEVWAAVIYAMTSRGSELPVHYNWVSGPEAHRTLSRPSFRVLERGDRIINEIEASWAGYRSQAVQPVWIGECPQIYHDLMSIQHDVFTSVVDALRPGVTVGELLDVTKHAVSEASPSSGPLAGCTAQLAMHGRGQGDDAPLVTNERSTERSRGFTLDQGNVFILKPSVRTADRGTSILWGDTVAIGPNGGYRLGTRAHGIRVTPA
jgi:Xaa-Pro aminopeptidase